MIRIEPPRSALIVAAAILAAAVGYRTTLREPPQEAVTPASGQAHQNADSAHDSRAANVEIEESPTDQSPPTSNPNDLHQDLVAMSEPVRNHILWRILGDAGFTCEEVRNSQLLGADAWRAECGSAVAYSIVIGEYNDISINPIPYGDFIP